MTQAGWSGQGSPGAPEDRAAVGRATPSAPPQPSPPQLTPPRPRQGGAVYGAATVSPPVETERPSAVAAPPSPVREKKRKKGLLAGLIAVVVVLGILVTGASLQLKRALPVAELTASVAGTLRIPGAALSLPWPSSGSAQLMIEGLGSLGGTKASTSAPIGSVAKVMTAYLVLKDHPLDGNGDGPALTVTAADVADYQSRIAGGQSLVQVAQGEQISEREALEALLLPSANNVAHMLAEWDAGGSADAFVTKMNQAAKDLGMTGTTYTDPSGFLPTTVSTPADQVKLAHAAIKDDNFTTIVGLRSATIPVAGTIKNYNDMLGSHGVFGIKTGSTSQAGGNLLFASHITVGDTTLTLVGAVFSQPGASTPTQLARVDTVVRKLLTAVEKAVKEYAILGTAAVGKITTAWGSTVTVAPDDSLRVIGWPGMSIPVKTTTTAPGATVTQGQVVGSITAAGDRVQLRATAATTPPGTWWKLSRRP